VAQAGGLLDPGICGLHMQYIENHLKKRERETTPGLFFSLYHTTSLGNNYSLHSGTYIIFEEKGYM
jgi:hypothetical protein